MTTTRRGRPRPEASIKRDEWVLKMLRGYGPLTRNQLSERLGQDPYLIYLALKRLRESGDVRKMDVAGMRNHWTSV